MSYAHTTPVVVTLWTPDPVAHATFYSEILGLRRDDHHSHTPNFKVGKMHIVLMPGEPQAPLKQSRQPWPIFAFGTPHYDAIEARLLDAAIPILERSPEGQDHEWLMFPDPAGNILELVRA